MGPNLEAAKNYTLPGETRPLENMDLDDLRGELQKVNELDEKLNPTKKRTVNGRDVGVVTVATGVLSGGLWYGMTTAGIAFTLANPFATAFVGAVGVCTFLGGLQLTSSNNKVKVLQDYEIEVVKPKLYIMTMLNHHGALSEKEKAELKELKDNNKTLEQRQARHYQDLEATKNEVEQKKTEVAEELSAERQRLAEKKRLLEKEQRKFLSRIHSQAEKEKELEERQRLLEQQHQDEQELLKKTRHGFKVGFSKQRLKHTGEMDDLKTKHADAIEQMQYELNCQQATRQRAFQALVKDKGNDIDALTVQRNILAMQFPSLNSQIEASLNPLIVEMTNKLHSFQRRVKSDNDKALSGSSGGISPTLSEEDLRKQAELKQELDQGVEKLKEEVETLKAELDEKGRELLKAAQTFAEKEKGLQAKLLGLEQLNGQLQESLNTNQQTVGQLQKSAASENASHAAAKRLLEQEKDDLQKTSDDLQAAKQRLEDELRTLQQEHRELTENLSKRDSDLEQAKADIGQLNQQMQQVENDAHTELKRLKEEHVAALVLEAEKAKTAAEQEWQPKVVQYQHELSELEGRIQQLQHNAEVNQKAQDSLTEKLTASQSDMTGVRELAQELFPEMPVTDNDFKTSFQQALRTLKDEKEQIESQLVVVQKAKDEVDAAYTHLEKEKEKAVQVTVTNDSELDNLRAQVTGLGNALTLKAEEHKKEVDSAQHKFEETLKKKQSELNELEKSASKAQVASVSQAATLRVEKEEAEKLVQQRDIDLQAAKQTFSEAQKQWELAEFGYKQQIEEGAEKAQELSDEVETLQLAEQSLKETLAQKDKALIQREQEVNKKDLVLGKDKEELQTLRSEKEQAEKALKELLSEKETIDKLCANHQQALTDLKFEYEELEKARNQVLLDSKAGLEKSAKSLEDLQAEFTASKNEFEQQKTKFEERHKQLLVEKADELARLKERMTRRATARFQISGKLLLAAKKEVEKAKEQAQATIEEQKGQITQQLLELEKLRKDKERLETRLETQRKAFVRHYGEPRLLEEGELRRVGDTSARVKLEFFDIQGLSDKSLEFDDVELEPNDMAGTRAKNELQQKLKKAESQLQKVHKQTSSEYDPVQDGLPTLAKRRTTMKTALQDYAKQIEDQKEIFERQSCGEKAKKAIVKNLEETLEFVQAGISKMDSEETNFQKAAEAVDTLVSDYERGLDSCATTKEQRGAVEVAFHAVTAPIEEVRDLAYARIVDTLVVKLKSTMPEDLPGPEDVEKLEAMRIELEEKKKVLQRFRPENLPLDTGRSLSARGKQYLDYTVSKCMAELEESSRRDDQLDEILPEDPRNEGGMVIARRMLADPKIRADVYSWFSSLQDDHAGVKKSKDSFDYYEASISGLEMIRHDHGMVYMPTPLELLTVIQEDLKEVDSKFTSESCRQHRGSVKNSKGVWRREKLADKCQGFLKKEEDNPLRGQSTLKIHNAADFGSVPGDSNDVTVELASHFHKDVLDCFAGTESHRDVITQDNAQTGEVAFTRTPVSADPNGLMNTFFEGCAGTPVVRVNRKTKETVLSVDFHNPQPGSVVFKKTKQGWKASLGGKSWWVDPSILIQNPKLQVPFEWPQKKQRDWIPMRDAHGNTSILVLRKSQSMGDRYFMYEAGVEGQLIPKPIGTINIDREREEALLIYEAALSAHNRGYGGSEPTSPSCEEFGLQSLRVDSSMMTSLATQQRQLEAGNLDEDVHNISHMQREWASHADVSTLTRKRAEIAETAKCIKQLAPLQSQSLPDVLKTIQIHGNELREVVSKKRRKQQAIQTFRPAKFAEFTLGAGFDAASDKYFSELQKKSGGKETPVIDAQREQCKQYKNGVFRELQVFKGCELDGRVLESSDEGSPARVETNFAKALKQNTDHCLRMQQQVDKFRARLVNKIRLAHEPGSGIDQYSDQQLLDRAVMEFEKGNIVAGIYDGQDEKNIKLLVLWMQAENDLRLHNRMKRKLTTLNEQLVDIRKDAVVQADESPAQFQSRCQKWNLEMALVASEMQALQTRLDSYKSKPLGASTRAIMSFERRAETVLRSAGMGSDQVREVESAIDSIANAMGNNQKMARVSQLGTGWGKSTMVQLWTDLACSLNVDHPERSVLVIAPTRNKLDLDQMLTRYYDQKGLEYQSLDLMSEYVDPASKDYNPKWWTGAALTEIHNQLLGLPKDTAEEDRAEQVKQMRAPVGASIQDVQILVHLRRKLQTLPDPEPADKIALMQLDGIIDLFRESMIFADEWDSALVPPLPHELEEVTANVNKALQPLGQPDESKIKTTDITHGHGSFIFGCKRKHLLSATTGTTYTAAVASGATNIEDVARKCNTDPYTTSARVWHLLEMAEPVMIDSSQGEGLKKQVYEKVVDRVGVDRPVMLFNSETQGQDNFTHAQENYKHLSDARQKVATTKGLAQPGPKGMLYYDKSKKLCQYLDGDERYDGKGGRNKNVALTREDEELIRANGGNMVDVCLGQSESVGTDAPQCLDSAGVFIGLFEQKENGRFDLSAQQMGRLTRATRSMRKPQQLFMVVDKAAVSQLAATEERNQYLASYEALQEKKKALAALFNGSKLPPAVEQAVAAPINVKPAVMDQVESQEEGLKHHLDAELKSLELTQWVSLKLSEDQIAAMRELKAAQWEAKVKYLELAAKELADRDVNNHTVACEKTLEQASVDSAMDRAYSEEDVWLKTLDKSGKVLDRFDFHDSAGGIPEDPETQLKTPEAGLTKKYLKRGMVAEVSKKLAAMPRRIATDEVHKEKLSEQFDPEVRKQDIKVAFAGIKENGLEFTSGSPVNTVHAELKVKSLAALQDARRRLEAIQAQVCPESKAQKNTRPHNNALINPLVKILDRQIAGVQDGDQSFDMAMATESFLQEFYDRLLWAVHHLAISDNDRDGRARLIKEQLKGVWDSGELQFETMLENKNLAQLMGESITFIDNYVPAHKNYDSVNANTTVHRLRWTQKQSKNGKGKVETVQPVARPWSLKEDRLVSQNETYKRLVRKKRKDVPLIPSLRQDFKWDIPNPSGTGASPGKESFKELAAICTIGKSSRYELDCWDRAKEFGQSKMDAFERCVEEMEQAVLEGYNQLQAKIKTDLHESGQTIQAQHQLMAVTGGS